MNVGGRAIATGGATATIDTGTSLMVVPETVADSIHAAIPNSFKSVSARRNDFSMIKWNWVRGHDTERGLIANIYVFRILPCC